MSDLKTIWTLQQGDKIISKGYPGEVLRVIEGPHPLLMEKGIEVTLERPNGKRVVYRDFEAVSDKLAFQVVSGLEGMDNDGLQVMIHEAIASAVNPIFKRLETAKRAPRNYTSVMRASIAILVGELLSDIKPPTS